MARYRQSIDLGRFIGARYRAITFTEGGKPITGIFIPTGINNIHVSEQRKNASGFQAFVSFIHSVPGAKYIETIKNRMFREGKEVTNYNIPAYQMNYLLDKDTRDKIRKVIENRLKAEHKEWANETMESNADLKAAVYNIMPNQFGDAYLVEEQQQQASYSHAPVAQQVAGYTAAADAPFPSADDHSMDDVPF